MFSTVGIMLLKGITLLIELRFNIPEIARVGATVAVYIFAEIVWHGFDKKTIINCIWRIALMLVAVVVSTLLGGGWNYTIFEHVTLGVALCSDMFGIHEVKELMKNQKKPWPPKASNITRKNKLLISSARLERGLFFCLLKLCRLISINMLL